MTDVLFGLQQEFPGFRIWQESHGDRKRYVACRVLASTRPHSVVTADPDELRDALGGEAGPGKSAQRGLTGRSSGRPGPPAARQVTFQPERDTIPARNVVAHLSGKAGALADMEVAVRSTMMDVPLTVTGIMQYGTRALRRA